MIEAEIQNQNGTLFSNFQKIKLIGPETSFFLAEYCQHECASGKSKYTLQMT